MEGTEGVTDQSVEAPKDASEESPAEEKDGAAPEAETDGEGKKEALPFGKHPRWVKMTESNKALRQEVERLKGETGSLQGAKQLHQWLSADPANVKAFMDFMEARKNGGKTETKDPYADFEPEVAERFRKLDALEKWKQEQDAERERQSKQTVEQNKAERDEEFDQFLINDGYMDKNGKGNEEVIRVIAKATLAELMDTAQNPNFPTSKELKAAYATVVRGLGSYGKLNLKKVTTPNVPASGSNRGSAAVAQGTVSSKDRIASIVAALG